MHEINFTDRSFNQNDAAHYSISIQVNNSGLTYCILNNETNNYILFRKHRFEQVILPGDLIRNVENTLEKDEVLSLPFHRIIFLGYTQQSTLIPEGFFEYDHRDKYLKFNHADDTDSAIFSNYIVSPGLYNVFALPDDLVALIKLHFRKVAIMNQTTTFLMRIASQPEAFNRSSVHLGLNHDFFDIACTGEGTLQLYNTFQFTGENDLLYYILFVFNKMGFDPDQIPLLISGELSSRLSYSDIIRQYIRNTRFDEAIPVHTLSPALKQITTSKFLNLLNVQACASSAENSGDAG